MATTPCKETVDEQACNVDRGRLLPGARRVRDRARAPTLCSFSDADGRLYEAVDIEPLAALETASSKCALAARDAMTCREVNCAPAQ